MGARDASRADSQKTRPFLFLNNQGLKKGSKSGRANPWDRSLASKLVKAKGKVGAGAGGAEKELNKESGKEKEVSVPKKNQRPRNSLLWWFKVIKAVCRLALDMKILAMSRTDHEAASEAYYQYVVGPNTDVTLFFDKRLFSRKRGSQVPLWAQAITVKKPQARTDKELDSLDELMMTVRSYREKFQCTIRKSVCQVFRYTNCERGRIVLRQNHRGVGFYLVYSGSLYVQKELEEKTGNKHLENIIRSGQHFGEVALLGDGLRTATVICREPSELFYIEKDDFAALCPQLFDDELSQKIKFAQRFELFKDWRDLNLHKLCLQSQVLYISHGQIIEADWLQTRYLYFVMQGCISLLKKFQVQQSVKRRHSPVHSAKHAKGRQEEEEEQRQEQEDAKWYTCVAVVGHLHSGDHSVSI
ncbi:Hypothetical predicted protein [Octopus vulgaris]|uniref:Cyclic nucleotide-binding domain-containing protein n=1 Tax=Octopus vulgaris TaxID=6645 RepID=A0AA36FRB4_OCTVU|nr:Hypothetical predicted protein [Octopus vulgaris]